MGTAHRQSGARQLYYPAFGLSTVLADNSWCLGLTNSLRTLVRCAAALNSGYERLTAENPEFAQTVQREKSYSRSCGSCLGATRLSKRSIVSRIMTTTSKRRMTTVLRWSVAWALALIASAILFKGNPAKDWIQSALFVGAITVWLWQSRQVARPRC